MKDKSILEKTNQPVDVAFNRIALGGTVIAFAGAFGSVACLNHGGDHGFDFRWHWSALLWMVLGAAGAFQLWRLVWRVQAEGTAQSRRSLARFCVALMLAAVGVFVYPILFVAGDKMHDVLFGFILAAIVLTFVGWMISRVIRGFTKNDEAN